jgi:hypothetical protein
MLSVEAQMNSLSEPFTGLRLTTLDGVLSVRTNSMCRIHEKMREVAQFERKLLSATIAKP